jgi:predicted N-acetyltransferase YhbS
MGVSSQRRKNFYLAMLCVSPAAQAKGIGRRLMASAEDPKLAEEEIRVISESRGWKPATVYGEKINYYLKQRITFSLSKQ